MRRVLNQLLVFAVLTFVVGVARYPYYVLPGLLEERIESLSHQGSVAINVVEPDINFPLTFASKTAQVIIPTQLGPLDIVSSNLNCQLKPTAFLSLSLASDCRAELLGGSISAKASRSIFSEEINLETNALNLNASGLNLFSKFALAAMVDASVIGTLTPSKQETDVSFSINIAQGSYTGIYKIMGLLQVPNISDISLKLVGKLVGRRVSLDVDQFNSSMGSASGSCELTLDPNNTPIAYNANIEVKLSSQGKAAFAPYLMLGAGNSGNANASNWQISVEKSEKDKMAVVKTRPI